MQLEETVSAFAAYAQQAEKKIKNNRKSGQSVLVQAKSDNKIKEKQTPKNIKENNNAKTKALVENIKPPESTGKMGKNARRKLRWLGEQPAANKLLNGVDQTPAIKQDISKKRSASNHEPQEVSSAKKDKLEPTVEVSQFTPLPNKYKYVAVSNQSSLVVASEKNEKKKSVFQQKPESHSSIQQEIAPKNAENTSKITKNPINTKSPKKSKVAGPVKSIVKEKKKMISRTKNSEKAELQQTNHTSPEPESDPPTNDSIEDGKEVFRWLISPIEPDKFFTTFWEKKPCLIQRNDSSYFSKLISCSAIDQMLLDNHVEFTKNIDITSYVDGVRETLNPEGRAMPPVVWGHYEDGCSIRLLNPQTFIQPVHVMNATLQEFFHCMVGTNVYLTPPNSQGFAPHYDDIEAFVIQIEGQKRWKLYNPRNKSETLPRVSSKNFAQSEIGEPILDKVLQPGDVLYFPRGTIHQACTQPGHHSLHITVSMYQKHSFADLFEILIPRMMSRAIESEVDLRRGVPLNIWHNLGKIFKDEEELGDEREEILETCEKLIHKVFRHADLDEAVDLMAKRFQHDALPPALTPTEKIRSVFGAKTVVDKNGKIQYGYDITLDTHVRLIRANVLRVVEEENSIRLYYYVDNSKEYHEYEPNFIEIEPESVGIVRQLANEYPDYICTSELEAASDDIKLSTVQGLFERGLLMVDEPGAT